VVQALGAEVPPKRIVELVRQNGITFELISETEAKLRRAGATAELLGVLRSLHSTAPRLSGPLLIKSNPPGAQVFLDGKPVGTTNAQGELGLGPHPPGECKVRLTLTGHEDHEQTISLVAGQPVSVPVTLKKYAPTRGSAAGQQSVNETSQFRVVHQHLMGTCRGLLTIGNGRIQYQADNGKDSFDFPLTNITYGEVIIGGGFYLLPKGGKYWLFHSDSTRDILGRLQQASGAGA
jgi:hypothetical protein